MTRHFHVLCLVVASALALAGCPSEGGFGPFGGGGVEGEGEDPSYDPYWCCDPDEGACDCPSLWHCTEGYEGKVCDQDFPFMPDDGTGWQCEYEGDEIVCRGNEADHPDAGQDGGWACTHAEGMVECRQDQQRDDHPDQGDGPWDCEYAADGQSRTCTESDGSGGDGGSWDCTTARDGTRTCVNQNPDKPDGSSEWNCTQIGDEDVCEGSEYPDDAGAGGWDCYQQAELIICRNGDAQRPPDDGAGEPYDCAWGAEAGEIVCVSRGDGGDIGDGDNPRDGGDDDNPGDNPNDDNPGDNGDNPGDDVPNGGDEGNCNCPPGAWRYCDTPTYCEWGIQDCIEPEPGRAEWSPCIEAAAPNGCGGGVMYDEEAEQCAIDMGYCAQDFWDLDWDGDNQETLGDGCQELACVAPADDGGFGGWF
jgi:hypothetical protein